MASVKFAEGASVRVKNFRDNTLVEFSSQLKSLHDKALADINALDGLFGFGEPAVNLINAVNEHLTSIVAPIDEIVAPIEAAATNVASAQEEVSGMSFKNMRV